MHYADITAERMLLALALSGHPEAGAKFLRLPQEAFTKGVHRAVADALRATLNRGEHVHAPLIAVEAAKRADTAHKAQAAQRLVTEIGTSAPPLDTFDFYARQLTEAMRIRELSGLGQRLMQLVDTPGEVDQDTVARQLRVIADDIEAATGAVVVDSPLTLAELLDEADEAADWLVPDLLERTDRLVLTAFEGVGKSELMAQFAATIAAGLHPFTAHPLPDDGTGHRVLVIDCENPRDMVRRRYRRVRGIVDAIRKKNHLPPVNWPHQLRLELRPDGIDLADSRQLAYLDERIAAAEPDLVVAGPLYKLHNRDMNEEPAARELVAALDHLRARHRFTLLLEAHSPHGEGANGKRRIRPVGSSLFLRWPEFGYGLRPHGDNDADGRPNTVEFVPWRGAREERRWPRFLRKGSKNHAELPWTPADAASLRNHIKAVN